MTATFEQYLRHRGLKPMSWNEVLRAVEAKLTPADLAIFQRVHRSFTAYPMEHTCRAFYDFAAEKDLLELLACFRYERLQLVGECLSPLPVRGRKVLELGAGGGYLSGYFREELGADVSVADWSVKSLHRLEQTGFRILSNAADAALQKIRFDFILCADCLGEVNADDDGWLNDPENIGDLHYPEEVENRYGFAGKLAPWKPLLRPGGSVLMFEPIDLPAFWNGAAASLRQSGWKAEILGPDPIWGIAATPG